MDTGIAPRRRVPASLGSGSRYERIWTATALVAAAVWIIIAVLQTPRLPLLGLAAGVGAVGGVPFVREPASSPKGRRQYVTGVVVVAAVVLVTVGIGHHFAAGLTVVALLACTSPWVIRWIA